MVAMKNGVV
ncbi:hypothetical protein MTR67_013427 [Solanum verrucosum]|uniref:Uncharacterized protein n=1 Tax=Solanum verrucosum TaxID=315347 RepID=A0AAF0QBU2_SOLVR|nr:hypothetical protein MTR67_013427 [Solanum verrucosum]